MPGRAPSAARDTSATRQWNVSGQWCAASIEHVHVHPPHALTEGREHEAEASDQDEHRLELVAVLLLAIATLATAWCGYQAARWSGDLSEQFAHQATARVKAAEAATRAGQHRIDDLLYFDGWLEARQSGNAELAAVYRRRFRAEFVPAFDAWVAQRPFTNPRAIAGPLYVPQYRSSDLERSAELDAVADEHHAKGTQAKLNADRYILATVFMAAVLFFAGISLRLEWRPLQIAVLCMACAMLLGGGAFVLSLPFA
jgi:hypothetical protein